MLDDGPLTGLIVIEMGSLIAGPFCAQLLADLGAEVIKLEVPDGGDPMRDWGHEAEGGVSLTWPLIGRNKKSVTCNLRTAEGQQLARRLIEQADVLVENFRPGRLEEWGLGPDDLSDLNPDLVVARVTGFGQYGPYAGEPGYGSIGEALGGLRYVTGDPRLPPSRVGISIGDSLAGLFATIGVLAALHSRPQVGGQTIDTAIYEAVLAVMESLIPEFALGGHIRERSGPILEGVAPSNVYPTSDGGMILIAANQDTVFRRLARLIGGEELAKDQRFATHKSRGEHQKVLDETIAAWTQGQSSRELVIRLKEAEVPVGKVYTAEDMVNDPHFRARESIVTIRHPSMGDFPMQNVVPKLSETPGKVRWVGPELGEHNSEIYRRVGVDDVALQDLQERGII